MDENQTDVDLNRIIEKLVKLLYPIQFDKEGGKHNVIGLIMDKADYTKQFSALSPPSKLPVDIQRINCRRRDRCDPRQSHTLRPHYRLEHIRGGGERSTKLYH